MKAAVNRAYGAFTFSTDAARYLLSKGWTYEQLWEIEGGFDGDGRAHPDVVEAIELLGDAFGDVEIIEVPDGVRLGVFNNGGYEMFYEVGHAWPERKWE